jgi:hypothetical protein
MSETSTTKSEPHAKVRTFATFRIAGDELDPDQITKLLKIVPTQAYAKGGVFSGGARSPILKGKTGVWFPSTDRVVASDRLSDHLNVLAWLLRVGPHPQSRLAIQLPPPRLLQLRQIMQRKSLHAVVTCFWHGPPKAKEPSVPRACANFFEQIPAEIETDFATDEGRDVA